MKRNIYISLFVFLGVLLQFVVHAVVEIFYINLLTENFATYGLGFSWNTWFLIHHALSVLLLAGGAVFGYFEGKRWWRILYVEKRYRIH